MTKPVAALVAAIPENAWTGLEDYPESGEAQIAEPTLSGRRLVVRRVRLVAAPGELFSREWRHFPFATNRTEAIGGVEAEHRQHAVVEQVIRDLKDQALTHFPSGDYDANAAWTVLACIAHNMLRWTSLLGLPDTVVRVARTMRRRLLRMPGRLTRSARKWTLHLRQEGGEEEQRLRVGRHGEELPPRAQQATDGDRCSLLVVLAGRTGREAADAEVGEVGDARPLDELEQGLRAGEDSRQPGDGEREHHGEGQQPPRQRDDRFGNAVAHPVLHRQEVVGARREGDERRGRQEERDLRQRHQ
jgi:hypothetical protein